MLRLSRDANILIHISNDHSNDLSKYLETYLTEIRTITRLNNIQISHSLPTNLSKYSFDDHITDNIKLVFNLNDDKQSKELIEKHEERLSKQVEKLKDDINTNDNVSKFYQENNDEENLQREQRRREILIDDIKLTQQRHETFIKLAKKRTIIEKKNKKVQN